MAQNAKAAKPTLGRNFLNVTAFSNFLNQPSMEAAIGAKGYAKSKSCLDLCLKGQKIQEVMVVGVSEGGLATCEFYARGGRKEVLFASAGCLSAIKPVVAKPAVSNVYQELDRLAFA
ncbi:MAG: hypothetical protein M0P64_03040 [Candidatus Pacebacteria bacterium]|jgi:hypothetical protein|nr:hypothetical protein [Candidatus Paceibacterota bacterium]